MSLIAVMDYVAARCRGIEGILNAYSAGAQDETAHFMPQDIDDGPVAIVMMGSGLAQAGNAEIEVHDMYVRVWVPFPAEAPDWVFKNISPMPERFKAEFRTDLTQGGNATRVLYAGYDEPDTDEAWGKSYLTLDIRLEVTEIRLAHDYTAPFAEETP